MTIDFFKQELVKAMKEKDFETKECLQMLISNLQLKEKESGSVSEADIIKIIKKEIKKLDETIVFVDGKRSTSEFINKKLYLSQFLPVEYTDEEILTVLNKICSKGMHKGEIMKAVVPIFAGKADNRAVSRMVDKFIQG